MIKLSLGCAYSVCNRSLIYRDNKLIEKLLVMSHVQISRYVPLTSQRILVNITTEYRTMCLTRRKPVLVEGEHELTFPVKG